MAVQWLWAKYFGSPKLAFLLLSATSCLTHQVRLALEHLKAKAVLLGGSSLQWPSSGWVSAQLFLGCSSHTVVTHVAPQELYLGQCRSHWTQPHLCAEKLTLMMWGLCFRRHMGIRGNPRRCDQSLQEWGACGLELLVSGLPWICDSLRPWPSPTDESISEAFYKHMHGCLCDDTCTLSDI